MASDRQRGLDAGMDDFLGKPLRPREVIAALDRAVARRAESVVSSTLEKVIDANSAKGDDSDHAQDSEVAATEVRRARQEAPKAKEVLDEEIAIELMEMETEDGGTVFSTVAGRFRDESEGQLMEIRDLMRAEDWAQLGPLAHRFGGAAAFFGGAALRFSALDVERASHGGEASEIAACLEQMERDCADLITVIDRKLSPAERRLFSFLCFFAPRLRVNCG